MLTNLSTGCRNNANNRPLFIGLNIFVATKSGIIENITFGVVLWTGEKEEVNEERKAEGDEENPVNDMDACCSSSIAFVAFPISTLLERTDTEFDPRRHR